MAWQTLKYKLTSSAPYLMHNGQTADPLNKWAKSLKQISSKRIKTDADHIELAHLEFFASLYVNDDGPILPIKVIDGIVYQGSKKTKEGEIEKSGCYCPEDARLEYDGPRTAKELWEDERFQFNALVRLNGKVLIPRMRPIFQEWQAVIALNVEDTLINPARVLEWLVTAGTQIGVGDWRPKYGRFTVEKVNGKK